MMYKKLYAMHIEDLVKKSNICAEEQSFLITIDKTNVLCYDDNVPE